MVNGMNYYITERPDELYHYGVKGMKWGVRKHIYNNMQVEGYRKASRYTEKRDIRNLKKQGLSRSQFKSAKRKIRIEAASLRGKKLVANNQTYKRVAAKTVGKSAAAIGGASAIMALGLATGGSLTLPATAMGLAGAGLYSVGNTVGGVRRARDIRAYRKNG